MSLTSEVLAYLVAQGVGTSKEIFADRLPASPARAMCVFYYTGRPTEYTTDGDALGHPGLQVRARDIDSTAAYAWMALAEKALTLTNKELSGRLYQEIRPNTCATPLEWGNQSITLVQSYDVTRSE